MGSMYHLRNALATLGRMSTAVTLLCLLAAASTVGTILEAGLPWAEYTTKYGTFWTAWLKLFGLQNVYSTWWFLAVAGLVAVSVVVCLFRNGPRLMRAIHPPRTPPQARQLRQWAAYAEVPKKQAAQTLRDYGWRAVKTYKTAEGEVTFWRRGIAGRVGYWLTHGGVVLLCIAGVLTGLVGYRGSVNLVEGETYHQIWLTTPEGFKPQPLPFTVRNDGFYLDFYPNGMPSQFYSDITITQNGQETAHTLSVNKPVFVGQYGIYQASYGDGGSTVKVQVRTFGEEALSRELTGRIYQTVGNGDYSFELVQGRPHTVESFLLEEGRRVPSTTDLGPSVDYILRGPDITPVMLRMYLSRPDLIGLGDGEGGYAATYLGLPLNSAQGWPLVADLVAAHKAEPQKPWIDILRAQGPQYLLHLPQEQRLKLGLQALIAAQVLVETDLRFALVLNQYDHRPYTGLLISYDPGAWLFWISGIMLVLGILCMLYWPFGRGWTLAQKKHTVVALAATRQVHLPPFPWEKKKREQNWS